MTRREDTGAPGRRYDGRRVLALLALGVLLLTAMTVVWAARTKSVPDARERRGYAAPGLDGALKPPVSQPAR